MKEDIIRKNIARLLAVVFGCTTAFILIVNLLKSCFSRVLHYYFELETLLPNPVLMICGTLCILCLFFVCKTTEGQRNPEQIPWRPKRTPLLITGTAFFVVQMYMIYNYCIETGWDVQILLDSARTLANGHRPFQNIWYYSNYPNNIFLTVIFAVILWITKPLHLGAYDFLAIVTVQSLLCVLTGFMLYQLIVRRWHRRDLAWLGMVLYLLLVGLSPWTSIPYSDAWGILIPIATLWAYYCSILENRKFLRWFLIAFLAYLGFKIKPQVFFVFLSIAAIEVVATLLRRENTTVRELLCRKGLIGACAGLASAFLFVGIIIVARPVPHRAKDRFGAAHFLMMGMNQEFFGGYCDDDVVFARQYKTPKERNKAELTEARRRIHEMELAGCSQLLCEKTLINYYDGTFSWGKEGPFLKTLFPEPNQHLAPFLRNLYYNRTIQGAYYPYWCTSATAVWLGVLVLMFLAALGRQDRFTAALMLSILLLTLYESIFEARARYLYAYIPFYILLALQGISNGERIITKRH